MEPGSLGMDILSGYRVLMDFPGGKMYLQSNTAVPAITVGPAPPQLRRLPSSRGAWELTHLLMPRA